MCSKREHNITVRTYIRKLNYRKSPSYSKKSTNTSIQHAKLKHSGKHDQERSIHFQPEIPLLLVNYKITFLTIDQSRKSLIHIRVQI